MQANAHGALNGLWWTYICRALAECRQSRSTCEMDATVRSPDIRLARGHPDNPLTNDDIATVFRNCLDHRRNFGVCQKLVSKVIRALNRPGIRSVLTVCVSKAGEVAVLQRRR